MLGYILFWVLLTVIFIFAFSLMKQYEKKLLDDFDRPASMFDDRPIHIEGDIWVNSEREGAAKAIVSSLKDFECLPKEFDYKEFYSSKPLVVTLVDGAIELFFLLEGETRSQAYNKYVSFLLNDILVSKDTNGNTIYYNPAAVNVFKEAAAISTNARLDL